MNLINNMHSSITISLRHSRHCLTQHTAIHSDFILWFTSFYSHYFGCMITAKFSKPLLLLSAMNYKGWQALLDQWQIVKSLWRRPHNWRYHFLSVYKVSTKFQYCCVFLMIYCLAYVYIVSCLASKCDRWIGKGGRHSAGPLAGDTSLDSTDSTITRQPKLALMKTGLSNECEYWITCLRVDFHDVQVEFNTIIGNNKKT